MHQATVQQQTASQFSNQLNVEHIIQLSYYQFRTFEEARKIASIIADQCPYPLQASMGLTEIFMNAIEHGNLNITFEEKEQLIMKKRWFEEINRRLMLKENIHKHVHLVVTHTPSFVKVLVVDEGNGFNWQQYEKINEKTLNNKNGRGILLAKEFGIDEIVYYSPGNKVECLFYKISMVPQFNVNQLSTWNFDIINPPQWATV